MNQGDVLDFFALFKEYINTMKDDSSKTIKTKSMTNFLEVDTYEDIHCVTEYFRYEYLFCEKSYYTTNFFGEKFEIKATKNFYENDLINFVYKKIPDSFNSEKEIYYSGLVFFEHPEIKLIIEFKCGANYSQRFYVRNCDKSKLNKILLEYKDFCVQNNLYKNKKVELCVSDSFNFLPDKPRTFESVALEDGYLDEIKQNVIDLFNNHQTYISNNLPTSRGILLSGVPGTGKTSIIDAICTELKDKVTIIYGTPKDMYNPSCVETLYTTARKLAPSIVVLEDLDLYGGDRMHGEYSTIIGELMNQLDGAEPNDLVVTIATTNHPERLDAALSNRPARFDRHLKFQLPNIELRKQIFNYYLNKHNYEVLSDSEHLTLLNGMKDFSGAQIQEVVNSAVLHKLSNSDNICITKQDIEIGIQKVKEIFSNKNEFKGLC